MKAKDIKHTDAYKQLKRCVELSEPVVAKRPAALGLLVKRFIARCEAQAFVDNWKLADGSIKGGMTVTDAFTWARTPEGDDFWQPINGWRGVANLNPCPIVAKKKVAKVAPKKKVGWWQ